MVLIVIERNNFPQISANELISQLLNSTAFDKPQFPLRRISRVKNVLWSQNNSLDGLRQVFDCLVFELLKNI
jgi:hypothetical protein